MPIDEKALWAAINAYDNNQHLGCCPRAMRATIEIYEAARSEQAYRMPDGRPIFGGDSPHDVRKHLEALVKQAPCGDVDDLLVKLDDCRKNLVLPEWKRIGNTVLDEVISVVKKHYMAQAIRPAESAPIRDSVQIAAKQYDVGKAELNFSAAKPEQPDTLVERLKAKLKDETDSDIEYGWNSGLLQAIAIVKAHRPEPIPPIERDVSDHFIHISHDGKTCEICGKAMQPNPEPEAVNEAFEKLLLETVWNEMPDDPNPVDAATIIAKLRSIATIIPKE